MSKKSKPQFRGYVYMRLTSTDPGKVDLIKVFRPNNGLFVVLTENDSRWANIEHRDFTFPDIGYLGAYELSAAEYHTHEDLAFAMRRNTLGELSGMLLKHLQGPPDEQVVMTAEDWKLKE